MMTRVGTKNSMEKWRSFVSKFSFLVQFSESDPRLPSRSARKNMVEVPVGMSH